MIAHNASQKNNKLQNRSQDSEMLQETCQKARSQHMLCLGRLNVSVHVPKRIKSTSDGFISHATNHHQKLSSPLSRNQTAKTQNTGTRGRSSSTRHRISTKMRPLPRKANTHHFQMANTQRMQPSMAMHSTFRTTEKPHQWLERNMNAQNAHRVLLESKLFSGFFCDMKLAVSPVLQKIVDKSVDPSSTLMR